MKILKRDGSLESLSFDKILFRLKKICDDKELGELKTIDPDLIAQKTVSSIYDGISSSELDEEAARIAIGMIENIEYSQLASRIIISNIQKNTNDKFSNVIQALYENRDTSDNHAPIVTKEIYDIVMEHKDEIDNMIDYKRDYLFDYFGYKTLEKSYLFRIKGKVVERPQHLYMRVSLQLHKNDLKNVKKTYDYISQHYYTFASPTMFNSGSNLQNLSSCFDENTIVATINKGPVKIKDVEIGDLVITHKGNVKKVVQLHKNELGNRKLYELSIYKTAPIKVTDNHKLFILTKTNQNEPTWISVEDIQEGDYVGIPNKLQSVDYLKKLDLLHYKEMIEGVSNRNSHHTVIDNGDKITVKTHWEHDGWKKHVKELVKCSREHSPVNRFWNIDNTFAKFVGVFYGDGHIMSSKDTHGNLVLRGIGITIYDKNQDLIDFCITEGEKLFGIKPVIHNMKSQNIIQVLFNSVLIGNIFKELFGMHFNKKKIWDEMYKWDKELVISMLEGLITTDGCISKDNVLSLQMSNVSFMRQLYYLLRNNNIDTSYGKVKKHKNATEEHVQISIPIAEINKKNVHKYYQDDRMNDNHINLKTKNQYSPKIVNGFKFLKFEKKKEITENLPTYVYTLGVEDDHSYNVEGIIAENCFLMGTHDSVDGIFKTMADTARISKVGGGIGLHVHNIRSKGSVIRGTNGTSDGIIPMLKVYNEISVYINQSGKRKGSFAIYLSPEHPDIIEFLDLRKNQGSEHMRARDLFLAMWIPDLFMKKVQENGDWYLMCPDECPGLNDVYGDEYEDLYNSYVERKMYRKKIKAQEIWTKILDSQMETGTPYLLYKDSINKKSNQMNIGVIKSSNLCVSPDTMILTSEGYYTIKSLENKHVYVWNGREFTNTVVRKTGNNQTLMTVHLSNGCSIKCTYYHKFYDETGKKIDAQNLKIGTKLIKYQLPVIDNKEMILENAYEIGKKMSRMCDNDGHEKEKIMNIEEIIVPINYDIESKINWLNGVLSEGYGFCSNSNKKVILLSSHYFTFLEKILYLLQTLGCSSYIQYGDLYNLVIHDKEINHLIKHGMNFKHEYICLNEEVYDELCETVYVKYIDYGSMSSETYCFKESERGMGMFNGVLTGNCSEITLYSDDKEYAVCFTGDTQILTDKGYRRIDECHNENVLSYFNNDKQLEKDCKYVQATLINNGEKDVYELKCSGMKSIKVTDNHPFVVIDNHTKDKITSYKWKTVKQLLSSDKILIPDNDVVPMFDNILTDDNLNNEYLTMGWLLGDGWQTVRTYGVCFGPKEIYARDKVISILCKISNSVESLKNDTKKDRSLNYYTDCNGVFNWASSKKNFVKYIQEHYGLQPKRSQYKEIPDKIKNAEPLQIASFLSGLFSADGTVYINEKSKRFYIGLSSTSEKLLGDVQILLKTFGITSRIVYGYAKTKNNYQGKLTIETNKSILNYAKYINFFLTKDKYEKLLHGLELFKKRDIFRSYCKIESLTYIGKEIVYDLNVPERHNFVAENFVVHNCNLANIALPKYVQYSENGTPYFDHELLYQVAKDVVLPMNNVIDYNYYPTPETKLSNFKHRPIGIGISGLYDVYIKMKYPFESDEAKKLNKEIFETLYYATLTGSMELAKKDGPYETFDGSPFSQGKFQFDLWKESDNINLDDYLSGRWDWESLRADIIQHGVRNSTLLTCMPTASSAQIMGNSETIEPIDSCIYKKRVLSGEYIIAYKYLVKELTDLGLWNKEMKDMIIANNGSIQNIDIIPDNIKKLYKTVWEMSMKNIIDQSADRSIFIDMTQSLNLFMQSPNYKKLTSMHFYAWNKKLKTGMYYLRQKVITGGKFSVDPELEKRLRSSNQNQSSSNIPLNENTDCEMCSA